MPGCRDPRERVGGPNGQVWCSPPGLTAAVHFQVARYVNASLICQRFSPFTSIHNSTVTELRPESRAESLRAVLLYMSWPGRDVRRCQPRRALRAPAIVP
jgi:hypothetical protein